MSDLIPGIVWPPLSWDTKHMLAQLRATESLTESQIQAGQLRQLRALAAHAREQTKWGHENLPEDLTWESFRALPVLDRTFVQAHELELAARRIPPEHGTTNEALTSGSTGTPVRVLKSGLCGTLWGAVTALDHAWHQRDLTRVLGAIRWLPSAPYPGLYGESWGPAAEILGDTGGMWVLNISTPTHLQLDWLDAHSDIAYLVTFPSNLWELLRLCQERGGREWPELREVRTVSEPVTDELRERCREVLGVEIVDQYSTQETGYIALQRPDGPGYYAMADTHVVEILDDNGSPCTPGQTGRVVVTPLHNFAMPLFRYAIGDLAVAGVPGPLPYPVIERIFGRTRNLLMAPDGTRRWAALGTRELVRIAHATRHQLIQVARDRIEVRLVVPSPVSQDQEEEMRAALAERTPAGIHYTFSYVDHIPGGAGGKFEDFICAVT